jgi:hypothetical protein
MCCEVLVYTVGLFALHAQGKIVHYSTEGPLFRHRVMLKVSVMRSKCLGKPYVPWCEQQAPAYNAFLRASTKLRMCVMQRISRTNCCAHPCSARSTSCPHVPATTVPRDRLPTLPPVSRCPLLLWVGAPPPAVASSLRPLPYLRLVG